MSVLNCSYAAQVKVNHLQTTSCHDPSPGAPRVPLRAWEQIRQDGEDEGGLAGLADSDSGHGRRSRVPLRLPYAGASAYAPKASFLLGWGGS